MSEYVKSIRTGILVTSMVAGTERKEFIETGMLTDVKTYRDKAPREMMFAGTGLREREDEEGGYDLMLSFLEPLPDWLDVPEIRYETYSFDEIEALRVSKKD